MKLFQKKEKYVELLVPPSEKKWYEKLFCLLKKD